MKLLFLSLLLVLQSLLLFIFNFNEISAQPLLKSATDFKVYQNKNHSFELMYPSNWTYIEFEDQFLDMDLNVLTSFISPLYSSLDTFQEYFTIKTKMLDPTDTFSNHFKLYLEKLKKSITNMNISKVEDISDKNKYLKYSFSPQPGLVINKDEYIFLNNDNNIFHLEFNSNNNDKTFESLINKIVSYFRMI
ncbi:MAG TPA: hypothetical protein VFT83_05230 [Nitrososphaeraceae archaeon]|nr:hypothetical protein [Nitrososphaeraceae archaeon]